MRFKAHTYQERAIRWIKEHRRSLLFLDMGLGKSVITLTAIQDLKDYAEVEQVLVVAPKKVAESTWSTEAEKWDHLHLRVVKVMGDRKRREGALRCEGDIYVVSRDSLTWLAAQPGMKRRFDMIVLDELSSFKNHRSQRFKACRLLADEAFRVVGLTGTPTPQGLIDLWAEVRIVDGGIRLGKSFRNYAIEHFHLVERNHIVIKYNPKPGSRRAIGMRINDIALTMKSEDYIELPGLIENDVMVELEEKDAKGYRDFERARVMELIESGGEVTAASAAALTSKLSQYANGAIYTDEEGIWAEIHRSKIEALEEIVESASGNVLVFYQYRHDSIRIQERLKTLRPRVYEGEKDLRDWNDGKIRVMLAHPASTAFGLNMQEGGHTVVWFSTGWNLELYQQANARLHRQGQRERVIVHRLVSRGTVDERMLCALDGKGENQEAFLRQMIEGMKDNL